MEFKKIGIVAFAALGFAAVLPAVPAFAGGSYYSNDCEPEPPKKEKKVKGNNGLGNGDQPAPGNSRYNNKAENYGDEETVHTGSGKAVKPD